MVNKLGRPESQRKPETPREQESHKEVRKVRNKVKSVPAKKSRAVEKPDFDENAMILKEVEGLLDLDEFPEDRNFEPPLPEIKSSPERLLSIELDLNRPVPPAVAKIIGKHETFWKAMEDEKAFKLFLKALPNLQKELDPDLLSEMLQICAEQSYEVSSLVQDTFYSEKPFSSWKDAVSNSTFFADFMKGYCITQVFQQVKPKEAVAELLMVAAKTSKANAQVILDKAERDAKGDFVFFVNNPPYHLAELLGLEAFDLLMQACRETMIQNKY